MSDYSWQEKALEEIKRNNFQATILAVTGSGKTKLALNVITFLKTKTLIVVPTIQLLNQWVGELQKIGVRDEDIGTYYGDNKVIKTVTVAVINSASMRSDWNKYANLLVVDEVHRVNENTQQFQKLLLNNDFPYRIGLTATLDPTDESYQVILQRIGSVVYEYKIEDAKKDQLVNDFTVVAIKTPLPINEYNELKDIEGKIKERLSLFGNNLSVALNQLKLGDYNAVHLMSYLSKKKMILNKNPAKVAKAIETIVEHKDKKIIVFGEYADTADYIYAELVKLGIPAWIYHSKTKHNSSEKKQLIEEYSRSSCGVLVTVKALDEGLNVTDASIGINLGYNSTNRQAIQRMGRILRKQEGKHPVMYCFYFAGTSDFFNVKNFMNLFKGSANFVWR